MSSSEPQDPDVVSDDTVIGGRWRVLRPIGEGAFGQVYEVVDTSDIGIGLAAVKLVHPDLSPRDREAFAVEAKKMATLRHPNLVGYLDSGTDLVEGQRRPYLVTELCDGSLSDVLAAGPLGRDDVMTLVGDVAAGLAHLHRRGQIHRDVKASNVLLAAETWKLGDFGLMRDLTATGTYHRQDQLMGTPIFMAPELFSEPAATAASDVYALGVLTHLAATGRALHRGVGQALIHQIALGHTDIDPGLDPDLRSIVEWSTRSEPGARPTAAELGVWLDGGERWATSVLGPSMVGSGPVGPGHGSDVEHTRRLDDPVDHPPVAVAAATTGDVDWRPPPAAGSDTGSRVPWMVVLLAGLAGLVGATIALVAFQLGTRAAGDDRLDEGTAAPTSSTEATSTSTTSTTEATTSTTEAAASFAQLETPGGGVPSRVDTIVLDEPVEVAGAIEIERDAHLFAFDARAGEEISVVVDELNGECGLAVWDMRVSLVDELGRVVGEPVTELVCGTAVGPWTVPADGPHAVAVVGGPGALFRGPTGSYELTIGRLERVSVPVDVRDEVELMGEIDVALDSQAFVFTAEGDERLVVRVEALNGQCRAAGRWDVQFQLIGPGGERFGQPVTEPTCRTVERWRLDRGGQYTLLVTGGPGGLFQSPTGSYEISVELDD